MFALQTQQVNVQQPGYLSNTFMTVCPPALDGSRGSYVAVPGGEGSGRGHDPEHQSDATQQAEGCVLLHEVSVVEHAEHQDWEECSHMSTQTHIYMYIISRDTAVQNTMM